MPVCETLWLRKWLDAFASSCEVTIADEACDGGCGSQDVGVCADIMGHLSAAEHPIIDAEINNGDWVHTILSAFPRLSSSSAEVTDISVKGVLVSSDEAALLLLIEQFMAERVDVVSKIRSFLRETGAELKSPLAADNGVLAENELLKREKLLLCDALVWTAWLRTRVANLGKVVQSDDGIDCAGLVDVQNTNEMNSCSEFYRRREELRKAFIDAMQSHDVERAALRGELHVLQRNCDPPLLQEGDWRVLEELHEIRSMARQKLKLCREAIAEDDDEEHRKKKKKNCLSEGCGGEISKWDSGQEQQELRAIEKRNTVLLCEIEECQKKLRERRRRTSDGEGASLLAQCSFLAARRDRLVREVDELSKACSRERAAHMMFHSEMRRIGVETEQICRKRRLTMAEKAVTMDLACEEHAQASIATTLRAVMSNDVTLRKSKSTSCPN